LDGNGTPKIENGVVTSFGFKKDNVTDISPVRALVGLQSLSHGSGPGKGILSDLLPLKGMPLTRMDCSDTLVSDLSPLKGMPLTWFSCGGTKVSDLSPLEGMNLREFYFTPTNITTGIDLIRQMKSLTTIGLSWDLRFPPDEFWKKYDAGEFNK
jgi:Leucine-rich repeat (LRR) protein